MNAYPIRASGRVGLIDADGNVILKPVFDGISEFINGLAIARKGERRGVIDSSGRVVVPLQFEWIVLPERDAALIPAQSEGKWGYYSVTAGGFSIAPRFSEAHEFSEGLAAVCIDGSSGVGYIFKSGEVAFFDLHGGPHRFSCGRKRIDVQPGVEHVADGKYGYIDNSGLIAVEPIYGLCSIEFVDGCAVVKSGESYFFIDVLGRPIGDRYSWMGNITADRLVSARQCSGQYCALSPARGVIFCVSCVEMRDSVSGYFPARMANGLWGVLDSAGKWAVVPKFSYVSISESQMVTYRGDEDHYGVIDLKNGRSIPAVFGDAVRYIGDLAKVVVDNKWMYIDRSGKCLWRE